MLTQSWKLLRILLNPRITATPLGVTMELRKRGIKRLPDKIYSKIKGGRGKLQMLKLIREWLAGELISRHNGQWVLNSFMPPFPGPAYNRMFENLLSGRRLSPVSAFMAVTAECPFACSHCSIKKRRGGSIDTGYWLKTIEQLHQLGTSIFGFTGGEPLMREALPELIKAAADGGGTTIVFSSGHGFTQETAEKLKKAGLWGFCVSLDSLDANETGSIRGKACALPTALDAIRIAVRNGFYTMTGTLASRRLVESKKYLDIYRRIRELGVHEMRIVETMPCGNLIDAEDDSLLTPEHIRELREFHIATNRQGKLPKVCAFNQVESPEFFGCGGGTQHMFIDHNGEVCPCDFTPMSFGNVCHEPLAAIWERMNTAMVNPRRHCFIRKNHNLVRKYYREENGLPLPPDTSCQICAEAGSESFPDYFAMVTGRDK